MTRVSSELASQNPLSPSNTITPLPAQQTLQPPSMRDRKDSQSSQGSAVGSGYGSAASNHRSGKGSSDQAAQMQFSPQDRKMYHPETRQSPASALGLQNYSFQQPAPQPSQQATRQEQPIQSRSQAPQRTADYGSSQAHSRVPANTASTPRQGVQTPSAELPRTQGQAMPAFATHSPSASANQKPTSHLTQSTHTAAQQRGTPPVSLPLSKSTSAREDRGPEQIPSPPPEMLVEPPTPVPGGDVATMESIQDNGIFSADRSLSRDVSPHSSRGNGTNAESHSPPSPGKNDNQPATNATKQRARLAPIVTSSGDASGSPQKGKGGSEAPSELGKEARSLQPVDRRAHLRRASFHPTAQPTAGYSRDVLLRSSFAVGGTTGALLEDPSSVDKELEDETLANVEELLEGFDWGTIELARGEEFRSGSTTEVFEARLLDELNALEAVSACSPSIYGIS